MPVNSTANFKNINTSKEGEIKVHKQVVRVAICAIVSAFSTTTLAGGGQTFALNLGGGGAQEAAPDPSADVVKVVARGVGRDKETALKDAYRDAVERAVGLYVDAETMAKNDEIVKDQVLTQSNAYITHYDEIEAKRVDGLMQVRIVATVKKSALVKNVQETIPGTTVNVNSSALQDAHAQLVSREKQAGDAAALLRNVMDKLDPIRTLVVPGLRAESQQLLSGNAVKVNYQPLPADKVMLRYLFELKLDRDKYFNEFVPPLKSVLDQIALSKKEVRLTELVSEYSLRGDNQGRDAKLKKFKEGSDLGQSSQGESLQWSFGPYWFDDVHVYSIVWGGQNCVWQYPNFEDFVPRSGGTFSWAGMRVDMDLFSSNSPKSKVLVALITQLKPDCSNGRVTVYELDKSTIAVFNEWLRAQTGGVVDSLCHGDKKTIYNILTLDENGDEIEAYPWEVQNCWMLNVRFAEWTNTGMVYICPFMGGFGESMICWKHFILGKEDLTKIKSFKVELAE